MLRKTVLALGALGFLATAGVALAETASSTPQAQPSASRPANAPIVLEVSAGGKVLLRGTIDTVSDSSLTVKSWGGDWTVNVASSTEVLPQGAALSSFASGDLVGVIGHVDQNANWTIDATIVRDWTARQTLNQERRSNVQAVRAAIQSGTPRNFQGTLSDLSGESFTLTTGDGMALSVSLTSNAQILQKNWLTLDFGQVQNGDTVRVWGPEASSTITASVFRDLSIPRNQ